MELISWWGERQWIYQPVRQIGGQRVGSAMEQNESGRGWRLLTCPARAAAGGLEDKATWDRDLQGGRSKPVGSLDSGPCSGNKRVQRPGRRGVLGALINICLLNIPILGHRHTDKLVICSLGVPVACMSRLCQCYLTVASQRQKQSFLSMASGLKSIISWSSWGSEADKAPRV